MTRTIAKDTKLLLFSGGTPVSENEWHFFTQNGLIAIQRKNEILFQILPLCDGSNTLQDIIEATQGITSPEATTSLILNLYENFVLVDRMRVYEGFMNYLYAGGIFEREISSAEIAKITAEVSLPPISGKKIYLYQVPPSTLGALSATRRTTYFFGDAMLTAQQLCCLFWSMYGIQGQYDKRLSQRTYTIPSGGGLYGLRFDLFLFHDVERMPKGHYLWHPKEPCFEHISSDYITEVSEKLFMYPVRSSWTK